MAGMYLHLRFGVKLVCHVQQLHKIMMLQFLHRIQGQFAMPEMLIPRQVLILNRLHIHLLLIISKCNWVVDEMKL